MATRIVFGPPLPRDPTASHVRQQSKVDHDDAITVAEDLDAVASALRSADGQFVQFKEIWHEEERTVHVNPAAVRLILAA